ncbi:MAG TPA: hypothetical protein VMV13_09500 [Candidatus Binataceae bacterium]|nr:hypothetical protein [Candidatus Binataceae bacterium]
MEPNLRLLVLGYGSLLSGYGLMAERRGGKSRLVAIDAEPAIVGNARRGLAKPSSHGSYLAMDLEPVERTAPIVARAGRGRGGGGANEFGGLILTFERACAPMIARREEYDPAAFERLIALADGAGASLGDFLMRIAENTRFDLLEYRRALRALVGYTSPGYVFHPVPISDGRVAITAIGSGYEGSGDEAVVSRRREFGIDRMHSLGAALAIASVEIDRAGQIGYYAECLMGGMHGLSVGDLMEEFDADSDWARELGEYLRVAAAGEAERFAAATALGAREYEERFGAAGIDPALAPILSLLTRARVG